LKQEIHLSRLSGRVFCLPIFRLAEVLIPMESTFFLDTRMNMISVK